MIFSPAGAHRWLLFILTGMLIATANARAQSLPTVQDAIKNAPTIGPAERASIDNFLTAATAQLQDPAVEQQKDARRAIETQSKVAGQPTATPQYLDVYAQLLNQKIKPALTDPSARVRLNAAVAVANVAQVAGNTQLSEAVQTAINDKSEAVVLWGIKGARWIILAQVKIGFGQPNLTLIKAIIPAVKSHPKGTIAGAIASDAYDALALEVSNPAKMGQIAKAQHLIVAPFVLELLQARLELYKKGVPPTPRAEATGTRYLSDPNVWPALTDAQRLAAMQVFCDLIALAAEQLKQANTGDQIDLKTLISLVGKAIVSAAAPRLDGPVATALKPVFNINKDTPVPSVLEAVKAVLPTVRGITGFATIKNPPAVVGHEAAPAPASAPTTGPVGAGVADSAVGNPDAKIVTPTNIAPTPAPAVPPKPAPAPKQPAPPPSGK